MHEPTQGDAATVTTPKISFKKPKLVLVDEVTHPNPEVTEPVQPAEISEISYWYEPAPIEETEQPAEVDAVNYIKPTELEDMSVDELREHEEAIKKAILDKQAAERRAVIDQIVEVVNRYTIPVEELVDALGGLKVKRKGVKAQIKYQDPVTGATWSGRGKEPTWIKDKDRSRYRVTN